jgi:hypothetical protein
MSKARSSKRAALRGELVGEAVIGFARDQGGAIADGLGLDRLGLGFGVSLGIGFAGDLRANCPDFLP